jgi:pimeloyl-ACP methyl ester carboxylesterase
LRGSERPPVLLIHGTGASAEASWKHGFPVSLALEGRASCTVDLPSGGLVDVQRSTEYVVSALRRMYRRAGERRIEVIGHSQGGLEPVWALRFWRDLRRKVSDVVALGTPYSSGVTAGPAVCGTGTCPEAFWQFLPDSAFLTRLRGGDPTPPGAEYTSIYSDNDQVGQPPGPAHELAGASLVGVQELCPGRSVDHFLMADDAAVYVLASFALRHRGGFAASDVRPGNACMSFLPPGVDPVARTPQSAVLLARLAQSIATAPQTNEEPPLRCYAHPGCGRSR